MSVLVLAVVASRSGTAQLNNVRSTGPDAVVYTVPTAQQRIRQLYRVGLVPRGLDVDLNAMLNATPLPVEEYPMPEGFPVDQWAGVSDAGPGIPSIDPATDVDDLILRGRQIPLPPPPPPPSLGQNQGTSSSGVSPADPTVDPAAAEAERCRIASDRCSSGFGCPPPHSCLGYPNDEGLCTNHANGCN